MAKSSYDHSIHHKRRNKRHKCPFLYWCGFINKTLKRLFFSRKNLRVSSSWFASEHEADLEDREDFQSIGRVCVCTCVCRQTCVCACTAGGPCFRVEVLWPIARSALRWFTMVEILFLTCTTCSFNLRNLHQLLDCSLNAELHQLVGPLLGQRGRGGGTMSLKLYIYSRPP